MANSAKTERKINKELIDLLLSLEPFNQIASSDLALLNQKHIIVTTDIQKLGGFFFKLFRKHPELFTPENVNKIAEFAGEVNIDLRDLLKVLEEKIKLMTEEKANMNPKTR